MSLLIKKSIGQVGCAMVGHAISEKEEDQLYIKPKNKEGQREIEATCERCNAKLLLRVDPTDEDSYLITEI